MVSKPKAKAQAKREKPKIENNKRRNSARGSDAELFRAVVEHSYDAILFLDSERKIFYASPSIAQISGYEPEELIGKSGIEFNHPDDREATRQRFLDLIQNPGKSISIENRLKHKDGSWFWVATTATNFLDHPQVQAVVLNMRDITERQQAEEALQESEERQRQIIENTDAGYFYIDQEGCFQKVNPAWLRMHKYESAEEIIGQHFSLTQVGADMTSARQKVEQLLNGQKIIAGEFSRKCKDGSVGYHTFSARAVTKAGEIVGLEGFLIDITERKQAEARQTMLYETLHAVSGHLDADEIARAAVDTIGRLSVWTSVAISLPSADKETWQTRAGHGMLVGEYGEQHSMSKGVIGRTYRTGKTQNVSDVSQDPDYFLGNHPVTRSQLAVPIRRREQILGVITIESEHLDAFTSADVLLVESFADTVSLALDNAHLYTSAQQEIVERKQAEEALRESEALYRQAIEVAGAVPYYESYYDENRKIKYDFIGEGIRQITGYSPEEFTAALWDSLILDIHLVDELAGYSLDEAIQRVRSGESLIWKCEHRIRHRNGEIRWVFEAAVEQRDENGVSYGSIGMYQDITERKRAEEALQKREDNLRKIVENMPVLITASIGDPPRDAIWNRENERLLGYRAEEILESEGRSDEWLYPDPAYRTRMLTELSQRRGDFRDWEWQMTAKDGTVKTVSWSSVSNQFPVPGWNSWSVGVDITERKQAEAALRESQQRLSLFFNQSLDGFFFSMIDEPIEWNAASDKEKLLDYVITHQHITEANDAMIEQYGSAREKFIGRTGSDFFAHDLNQARRFRKNLFDTGHIHLETEERKDDGTPIWIEGDYVCMFDDQNRITGMFGIQRDVTERKQAQDELRVSEERYRGIFQTAAISIWEEDYSEVSKALDELRAQGVTDFRSYLTDHPGFLQRAVQMVKVLDVNESTIKMYGAKDKAELLGSLEKLVANPDNLREELITFAEGKTYFEKEATDYRSDGSLVRFWLTITFFTDAVGLHKALVCMNDITERKQAEESLREAENKYRNLVERLTQVIYTSELGNNGVWSYVSPQIEKLLGFTPQEWMNNPELWYQQIHPDDRDIQSALEERAYAQNEPFEAEYRILTRAGNWIWIRDSGHIFPPQGYGLPIVQGILTDVTERKQAEAAVSLSKAQLLANLENTPHVAVQWYDKDGRILYLNPASESLYGYTSAETIGKTLDQLILTPEEQMEFMRILAEISKTGNAYGPYEAHIKNRAGEDHWVLATTFSQPMNDGQVGFVCMDVDITERKQAEDNLRKAEAKYRMLVEQIPPIIYLALPGQHIGVTYISPQIKTLGFTEEEWLADPELWLRQIHPDDQAKVTEYIERISQSGEPYKLEYRLITRTGVVRWFIDEVKDIVDETGNVLFRQGFMLDITERKQSEEALSISKAQLLANLEHTPNVAVQWYDKDGQILYWNPASESMYGWKSSEALGKTLEQLIHTPEEQLEFMRILADIQATGSPFGPYEAQIRRKDGTNGWVLATTFSIPMPDGQFGFVCMDVDINERKQAEELIQRQLRRLNALHTIDMAINSSANVQITLEVLLSQTLSQLNIDAADVLLFNQPAQTLELTASRGFRSNINLQSQQRLGDGFAGQVINGRRTIHISNLMEVGKNLRQMLLLAHDSFIEYFGVPLIAKGQIKGVLEIYHRSPLNPADDWLNFLEVLAGQAAIAIDNSQLVNGLQRSNMEIVIAYDATIEGWSRAMDLRDKETEGHTQRVTTLTLKLARAMGIREADIIQIQRGGLLHDIGKLGVPDNILLKPGPLTDEEWAIMRQHPAYAFNMIAPVNYLKPALDIPYCHHEKWDGTGYPRGLQGEQIPLAARIFAVVDVWDALTSDRPYRPAWTKEKTLEHILSLSGTHFDPKVVDAFFELHDRGWQ